MIERMIDDLTKKICKNAYNNLRMSLVLTRNCERRVLSKEIIAIRSNVIFCLKICKEIYHQEMDLVYHQQLLSLHQTIDAMDQTSTKLIENRIDELCYFKNLDCLAIREKYNDITDKYVSIFAKKLCNKLYDYAMLLPYLISDNLLQNYTSFYIERIDYSQMTLEYIFQDILHELIMELCQKQILLSLLVSEIYSILSPVVTQESEKVVANIYNNCLCNSGYIINYLCEDIISEFLNVQLKTGKDISIELLRGVLASKTKSVAENSIIQSRVAGEITENFASNSMIELNANTYIEQSSTDLIYINYINTLVFKDANTFLISDKITEDLVNITLCSNDSFSQNTGMVKKISNDCILTVQIRDAAFDKLLEIAILKWRCLPAYLYNKMVKKIIKEEYSDFLKNEFELTFLSEKMKYLNAVDVADDVIKETISSIYKDYYDESTRIETVAEYVNNMYINDILQEYILYHFKTANQKKRIMENIANAYLLRIERKIVINVSTNYAIIPDITGQYLKEEMKQAFKMNYRESQQSHFLAMSIVESLCEIKINKLLSKVFSQAQHEEEYGCAVIDKMDIYMETMVKKICCDTISTCRVIKQTNDLYHANVAKKLISRILYENYTSLLIREAFLVQSTKISTEVILKKSRENRNVAKEIFAGFIENAITRYSGRLEKFRRDSVSIASDVHHNFLVQSQINFIRRNVENTYITCLSAKDLYNSFVSCRINQAIMEFRNNRRSVYNKAISLEIVKDLLIAKTKSISKYVLQRMIITQQIALGLSEKNLRKNIKKAAMEVMISLQIVNDLLYEEYLDSIVSEYVFQETAKNTTEFVLKKFTRAISRNKIEEVRVNVNIALSLIRNTTLSFVGKIAKNELEELKILYLLLDVLADNLIKKEVFPIGTQAYLNCTVGITFEKKITSQLVRDACSDAIDDISECQMLLLDEDKHPEPAGEFKETVSVKEKSFSSSSMNERHSMKSCPSPKKVGIVKKITPTSKCIICQRFIPIAEAENHALTCVQKPKQKGKIPDVEKSEENKSEVEKIADSTEEIKGEKEELTLEYINQTMLLLHKNIDRKIKTLELDLKPTITSYKTDKLLNNLKKILMSGLKNNYVTIKTNVLILESGRT